MDAFAERYGPWALVLGGSEGVGEAFAAEVAARGVAVVLIARTSPPAATSTPWCCSPARGGDAGRRLVRRRPRPDDRRLADRPAAVHDRDGPDGPRRDVVDLGDLARRSGGPSRIVVHPDG
ncbi:MAG TPA: hypothetical protein VD926_09840 [Acidimicrobiales bacterium]|nr:hypothetical protein [Acidimicrobiales bacterium]